MKILHFIYFQVILSRYKEQTHTHTEFFIIKRISQNEEPWVCNLMLLIVVY